MPLADALGVVVSGILREEDPRPLKARVSLWRERLGPLSAAEFPSSATDQVLAHFAPSAFAMQSTTLVSGARSHSRRYALM